MRTSDGRDMLEADEKQWMNVLVKTATVIDSNPGVKAHVHTYGFTVCTQTHTHNSLVASVKLLNTDEGK